MTCIRCGRDVRLKARGLCTVCYRDHSAEYPLRRSRRVWTAKEREYLREHWGKLSVKAIAHYLSRPLLPVYKAAYRFGLPGLHQSWDEAKLRLWHRNGWTGSEMARKLGRPVNTVGNKLKRMGLAPHDDVSKGGKRSPRVLSKRGKDWAERRLQVRCRCYLRGWEVESLAECDLLDCLYECGPSTARQVGDSVGYWRGLHALQRLMRAGLIVRLGFWDQRRVFSLPHGVRRKM